MHPSAHHQHPLYLLKDLADHYSDNAAATQKLPRTQKDTWSGLAIRLGQQYLAVPLQSVSEIFSPRYSAKPSAVPGAKAWLIGLVSLRSQLLPMIDFRLFLGEKKSTQTRKSRVLVLKQQTIGLLVDEVIGIRHFEIKEQANSGPRFEGRTNNFLAGVFLRDGVYWGVCNINKLLQDPDFNDAASG